MANANSGCGTMECVVTGDGTANISGRERRRGRVKGWEWSTTVLTMSCELVLLAAVSGWAAITLLWVRALNSVQVQDRPGTSDQDDTHLLMLHLQRH